jgi:hypothetical protein
MMATKVTSLDTCERVRQFSSSVLCEWVGTGDQMLVTLESAKEIADERVLGAIPRSLFSDLRGNNMGGTSAHQF